MQRYVICGCEASFRCAAKYSENTFEKVHGSYMNIG